MNRSSFALILVAAAVLAGGWWQQRPAIGEAALAAPSPAAATAIEAPLFFEPNVGQAPVDVRFLSHGPGVMLSLRTDSALLNLRRPGEAAAAIALQWRGGSPTPAITAESPLPGRVNYLHGRDEDAWLRDIPSFARMRYAAIYPGIDVVFYGDPQRLEYDFLVAPGARPQAIQLAFGGIDRVTLDAPTGDLLLEAGPHHVRQHRPVAYQDIGGTRVRVDAAYVVAADGIVTFALGAWDRSHPLVIDPVIDWASYVGGAAGDWAQDVAVSSLGDVIVVGSVTTPWEGAGPSFEFGPRGNTDAYLARYDRAGAHLSTTFFGGGGADVARSVAIDPADNIYITGTTTSLTFPTTGNAAMKESPSLQVAFRTGLPFLTIGELTKDTAPSTDADAFITKLVPTGDAVLYSSYLGGSPELGLKIGPKVTNPARYAVQFQFNPGTDEGKAIAVDASGMAYVVGVTLSDAFPVTDDAFKTELNGFFGAADGFIMKIDTTRDGSDSIRFSSYIGGSCHDEITDVAVDLFSLVYITGHSDFAGICGGFATTQGALHESRIGGQDAFVAKLRLDDEPGAVYSTFIGTSVVDFGGRIGVDDSGNAYATYLSKHAFISEPPSLSVISLSPDGRTARWTAGLGQVTEVPPGLNQGDTRPYGFYAGVSAGVPRMFALVNGPFGHDLYQFSDMTNGSRNRQTIDMGAGTIAPTALAADARRLYIAGVTTSSSLIAQGGADSSYDGQSDGFVAVLTHTAAPVITRGAAIEAAEGQTVQVPVLQYTRASSATTLLDGTVHWGDGTSETFLEHATGGATITRPHTYADDGVYAGRTCLVERGAGEEPVCAALAASIANAPPMLTIAHPAVTVDTPGATFSGDNAGLQLFLSTAAAFTDGGIRDTHTATIQWTADDEPVAVDVAPGSRQVVNVSRLFDPGVTDGATDAELCVTDNDGARACGTFSVRVPRADLRVERFGPARATTCAAVDFRVKVTNQGPDTARNVVIRDLLPDTQHLSYLGALTLGGSTDGTVTAAHAIQRPSGNFNFGRAVALEHTTAAITDGDGPHVYERDPATFEWRRVASLEGVTFDSAAIRGDWLAVSRSGFHTSVTTVTPGRVTLFKRVNGAWPSTPTQVIAAPEPNDGFGSSVAIGDDYLAVGDKSVNGGRGLVHLYRRDGDAWTLERTLGPAVTPAGFSAPQFGASVALTPNGRVLAVGAPEDRALVIGGDQVQISGSVYVYRRAASDWLPEAGNMPDGRLVAGFAPNNPPPRGFGAAIALNEDNVSPYLVIGAPRDQAGFSDPQARAGRAYVARRNGAAWALTTTLTPNDSAPAMQFGRAVDISGTRIIVGTGGPGAAGESGVNQDRAYVFGLQGSSASQLVRLRPGGVQDGDGFGEAVAISGAEMLVGAPRDNRGRAYVFSSCGQPSGAGSLACNVGTLPTGASAEFLVSVQIGEGVVPAGQPQATITTRAEAAAGAYDPTSNTATLDTVVSGGACGSLADVTPPSVIPVVTGGEPGNNGWFKGGTIAVHWFVTDVQSAIDRVDGCEASIVSDDTDGLTFTCTATSAGGTATASTTVRRDSTPPSLSVNHEIVIGPIRTGVGLFYTCDDPGAAGATSGVQTCAPAEFGRPGTIVTRTIEDRAGNRATSIVGVPLVMTALDQRIEPGAGCTAAVPLSAAGSYDPTGAPLAFSWLMDGRQIATGAAPTVMLPPGEHAIDLVATTSFGIVMPSSTRVTVVDTTPPGFASVPPAVIVDATGALTPVAVGAPAIQDACDVTVTAEGPSAFPVGESTVVFRAVDGSGNASVATTRVTVRPNVNLVSSFPAGAQIHAGGVSALTLSIANSGLTRASSVIVRPSLPAGVTPVLIETEEDVCRSEGEGEPVCTPISVYSPDALCTLEPAGLECLIYGIEPGQTVNVALTLSAPATAFGPVDVSFTAGASEPDVNPSDNTAAESILLSRTADLALTLAGPAGPVTAGGAARVQTTVRNLGPSSARDVVVTLPFGAVLSLSGAPPPACALAPAGLACHLPEIQPGATVTIDPIALGVSPSARGVVTIGAAAQGGDTDPVALNNAASLELPLDVRTDLSVQIAPDRTPLVAGAPVTWQVTVANAGPSQATDVTVQIVPQANVVSTAALPPGCAVTAATEFAAGRITCTMASLGAGDRHVLAIASAIDPFARGQSSAAVAAAAAEIDVNDQNDIASVSRPIDVRADLIATMTATPDAAVAGETLGYRVTIGNAGPSGVTRADLRIGLPATATVETASECTAGADGVQCLIDHLAPSSSSMRTVLVRIAGAERGPLAATAAVSAAEPDPDLSSNDVAVTTPVRALTDLGVDVSAGPLPVAAGQFLVYTIAAVNDGPSTATGVTITHRLPAGATSGVLPPECVRAVNDVSCDLEDLESGGTAFVLLRVVPVVGGILSASTRVTGAEQDSDLSNNTALTSVRASGPAGGPAGAGDFDGDGMLDVAVADEKNDRVTIYLNVSGALFERGHTAVGRAPVAIAVGDVDGDRHLDIVTVNRLSGDVSVLSNDGQAVFTETSRPGFAGRHPVAVVLGDFTGDGALDIVAALRDGDGIALLTRGGAGDWIERTEAAAGSVRTPVANPAAIAAGDFDGDGHLDVAYITASGRSTAVLRNDGTGSFTPGGEFPVNAGPQEEAVTAGDFNGDGHLDVAVVGRAHDRVSMLINDGVGGFAETSVTAVGKKPDAMAAGDMDGDGAPDLVTANRAGDSVSTLFNVDGAFPAAIEARAARKPIAIVVADFDGDGRLDILVVSEQEYRPHLLLNRS